MQLVVHGAYNTAHFLLYGRIWSKQTRKTSFLRFARVSKVWISERLAVVLGKRAAADSRECTLARP